MRSITPILAALAIAGAACTGGDDPVATGDTTPPGTDESTTDAPGTGGTGRFVRALVPFDDCDTLLDHLKAEAIERVGPYGLDGHGGYYFDEIAIDVMEESSLDMAFDDAADEPASAEAALGAPVSSGDADDSGGAGDRDFSTTNVQEVGVDEPDIIKTDGQRIVTISENRLTVVDATGNGEITGSIDLPEGWNHELFFAGDRAIVLTNGGSWGYPMPVGTLDAESDFAAESEFVEPGFEQPAALVFEIDLSGSPSITSTMRIEGRYLSARAIGDTIRLAVAAGPRQLPWLFPSGPGSEDRATEANRDVIETSTLDDWLPSYEVQSGDTRDEGQLLACDRMHRPEEFAGFDVVSIVDLSLADGLADGIGSRNAVGVLAAGDTIYSSPDRFYVATSTWMPPVFADDVEAAEEWTENYRTDLHAFAIATGEPAEYVASGSVEGSLLNQFSIDEHDGYVRVLTTEGSPWNQSDLSETQLTVLDEQENQLVEVGNVGGLGKGEQLFSARLLDDIGFAVTFRQIDPFYVLDLSDPTNPSVSGELKIPGFSTYLHPVGDDRVLGIGQAATEEGFTTGLKLSLFDVSDPSDPREIAIWTAPNANSPAEHDHRSFQMWGSTAILPVQSWSGGFNGAIVFEIGDSITELGRITHAERGLAASDCRQLTIEDMPEDSEFFWMMQDSYTRVQLCDQSAVGGFGDSYCDLIPAADVRYWFGDEAIGEEFLARVGATSTDRFEICWPENDWQATIQRSVIIDDTLWTLAPGALQANDFTTFEFVNQLPLR